LAIPPFIKNQYRQGKKCRPPLANGTFFATNDREKEKMGAFAWLCKDRHHNNSPSWAWQRG